MINKPYRKHSTLFLFWSLQNFLSLLFFSHLLDGDWTEVISVSWTLYTLITFYTGQSSQTQKQTLTQMWTWRKFFSTKQQQQNSLSQYANDSDSIELKRNWKANELWEKAEHILSQAINPFRLLWWPWSYFLLNRKHFFLSSVLSSIAIGHQTLRVELCLF